MDNPSGQATNNIGQKSDENLTLTDHLNKKLLEAFKNTLDTPGFPSRLILSDVISSLSRRIIHGLLITLSV